MSSYAELMFDIDIDVVDDDTWRHYVDVTACFRATTDATVATYIGFTDTVY